MILWCNEVHCYAVYFGKWKRHVQVHVITDATFSIQVFFFKKILKNYGKCTHTKIHHHT